MGAKNGILFKTAVSLEETGRIKIVALDKTGTITKGEPRVTDIIPMREYDEETLLRLAYSLEIKSEHPLAKAIVNEAECRNIKADALEEFKVLPGNGLTASHNGNRITGGSFKFISEQAEYRLNLEKVQKSLQRKEKHRFFLCRM